MEKTVPADYKNKSSQKSSDSQSSEKSDQGSQIIITSKHVNYSTEACLKKDNEEPPGCSSGLPISTSLEVRNTIPSDTVSRYSPTSNSHDARSRDLQYCERTPLRTKSTPNLSNKTKRSYSISGLRRRPYARLRSQPPTEHKCLDGNLQKPSPLQTRGVLPTTGNRRAHQGGISGLFSRLTSFVSSRTLETLDEQVLNNFNLEVGTVASRVEMWRHKL